MTAHARNVAVYAVAGGGDASSVATASVSGSVFSSVDAVEEAATWLLGVVEGVARRGCIARWTRWEERDADWLAVGICAVEFAHCFAGVAE